MSEKMSKAKIIERVPYFYPGPNNIDEFDIPQKSKSQTSIVFTQPVNEPNSKGH